MLKSNSKETTMLLSFFLAFFLHAEAAASGNETDAKAKAAKASKASKTSKAAAKKRGSKAEDKTEAARYFQIPVFYLTDRNEENNSLNYGSKRKYAVNCKHEMNYGMARARQSNLSQKQTALLEKTLGWRPLAGSTGRKSNQVECQKIEEKDSTKNKEEFFNRLQKALSDSQLDNLCLFVHGAEESFNDAVADAAELAYTLEYPIILYSWPSNPKARDYLVDNGNNEWSQQHFDQFIKDLSSFQKSNPFKLTLVAHSMGNRLPIRAAHLLQDSRILTDIELVSPDIDAETFKHYIFGMQNRGAVIRLYTSSKDKMLPLSQMIFGGYYRLGEGVGEVFGFGKNKASDESDDYTKEISGSSTSSGGTKDSLADKSQVTVKSGTLLPAHKQGLVERIDFTEIDSGIRGHSIPFELLASMIKTNSPGKGLRLAPAKAGKGSKLARFVSWSDHLGKVSDENDCDLCKRIVKTED